MSESFVSRVMLGQSIAGTGPLTRSIHEAHTSGFIRPDAPHWSIEPYIPLAPSTLIEYLIGRDELRPGHVRPFRECCEQLDKILHERSASYRTQFTSAYLPVDPDADQRLPKPRGIRADSTTPCVPRETLDDASVAQNALDGGSRADSCVNDPAATNPTTTSSAVSDPEETDSATTDQVEKCVVRVMSLCQEILTDAGFRRLEIDEVKRCVGVVSQFGVPLHVDLGIFRKLDVYARGDIIGSRIRRRLRNFYRRESIEVQVYQRMVLVFQLCDDDDSDENLVASAVHLRMFKNVPKQDVDTLLPGTRVRISGIDRAKIIVPSLGGFLMSLRKIAQYALLFAVVTLHWSAILLVLLIGYLVKSVFSYFQTKNRYQLNLTRNLYFQKLDANAGVGYHAIEIGHHQLLVESILAQFAILTSAQALSTRRLRRKCERLMREAIDVEIDFQVDRALESLIRIGSVRPTDDSWIAEPSKFL